MNELLMLFVVLVIAVNTAGTTNTNSSNENDAYAQLEEAIIEHNQEYEEGKTSFKLKLDRKFWATTNDSDFMEQCGTESVSTMGSHIVLNKTGPIPASFDWRDYGAVTAVKHQRRCLSCWSFAVTGALEALHRINRGELLRLSPQYLVDCIPYPRDQWGIAEKCYRRSNSITGVLKFVQENGMRLEDDYPYKGKGGECNNNTKRIDFQFKITHIVKDERKMKEALYRHGPLIAVVHKPVYFPTFELYDKGIFYVKDCDNLEWHVVLIVGYGRMNGKSYWIIKFTYGINFADDGYLMLARNKNACHISYHAFSLEQLP